MNADQPTNRIEQSLEILTDQVGRLTEGLVELRITLVDEIREVKDLIRQQGEEFRADMRAMQEESRQQTEEFRLGMTEIKGVVQQQADTTASLVKIVEKLLNEKLNS